MLSWSGSGSTEKTKQIGYLKASEESNENHRKIKIPHKTTEERKKILKTTKLWWVSEHCREFCF